MRILSPSVRGGDLLPAPALTPAWGGRWFPAPARSPGPSPAQPVRAGAQPFPSRAALVRTASGSGRAGQVGPCVAVAVTRAACPGPDDAGLRRPRRIAWRSPRRSRRRGRRAGDAHRGAGRARWRRACRGSGRGGAAGAAGWPRVVAVHGQGGDGGSLEVEGCPLGDLPRGEPRGSRTTRWTQVRPDVLGPGATPEYAVSCVGLVPDPGPGSAAGSCLSGLPGRLLGEMPPVRAASAR
jgi:hypothetical protein